MMRKKSKLLISLCLGIGLFLQSSQLLAVGGTPKKAKEAILLVAFGTSVAESRGSIDRVGAMVAKEFPHVEIRWAYTSKIIRTILKKRGEVVYSPAEALAKLGEEGFPQVYVQSLHVIPGDEYTDLVETVKAFNGLPKSTEKVSLGLPLLTSDADMEYTARVLSSQLPANRKATDAVVYMGHGTKHPSNIYYPAMQYYLSKYDANLHIGTVEGTPTLTDVVKQLKSKKVKRVWLMPFMLVAGDHAINDMAGDDPSSWKSILTKQGFEVKVELKGLGDYDELCGLWVSHLKAIVPAE